MAQTRVVLIKYIFLLFTTIFTDGSTYDKQQFLVSDMYTHDSNIFRFVVFYDAIKNVHYDFFCSCFVCLLYFQLINLLHRYFSENTNLRDLCM